ncbi:hypothetical protein NBRC116599_08950 [Aquicoccus sp. SU-CL01552]
MEVVTGQHPQAAGLFQSRQSRRIQPGAQFIRKIGGHVTILPKSILTLGEDGTKASVQIAPWRKWRRSAAFLQHPHCAVVQGKCAAMGMGKADEAA